MKKNVTRRRFIQHTGTGLAGVAALGGTSCHIISGHRQAEVDPALLPQPIQPPGVHAYSLEKSVQAGKTIEFCVSNTVPCRLSICRLGLDIDDPKGDEVLHTFPEAPPKPQPVHPGSYIHVAKGLPERMGGFALECWVRPWKTDAWAGLISQHDYPGQCGYGLFLSPKGKIGFYLGDGGPYRPEYSHETKPDLIKAGQWHHIVATWNGARASIWLNGTLAESWGWVGPQKNVKPGPAPLRLGAYGQGGQASNFLEGDLAMPVVYRRSLRDAEIMQRFTASGLRPVKGRIAWACWPLDEEQGDMVRDCSGENRDGQVINHATWMIGGPSFKADVDRFGSYDPEEDPKRGHGIRFASDDLYDCRWEVTHAYRIPPDAKPGIYVGRLEFEQKGKARLYHATFIVRQKRRRKRKPPILVLCSSNTWLAYSGTPFAETPAALKQAYGTGGGKNAATSLPAFNLYQAHKAGQGTMQMGLRMPWPAAGPYILYGAPTDYSHLMRAERFMHVWLEQAGYTFDVISDLDLHRDPDQLRGYQAVVINGHSEYWSVPMYTGLERYLDRGGNVVCLSGNSLFWRVSFNRDGTIMECRKVDAPGNQLPPQRRGEAWHSHDRRRGGLMRECGYPGWKLVGLETLGWNNPGNPEQFGAFIVEQPEHFLFQKPETVPVQLGDPIGQAPDGGLPRANGHEIDVRLSTLKALQKEPSPATATVPADPAGMTRLANGVITWKIGGAAFDYFFRPVKPGTDQGGEMIYWERPEGGRVFNTGSIGTGWALHSDPRFQRLMKNVLHHFGVPEK